MPNHVTNRLTIKADSARINEIFNHIKRENEKSEDKASCIGTIDFNKVIPMPDDLNIQAHSGIITAAEYAMKDKFSDYPPLASLEKHNRASAKSPLEFTDEEWNLFIKVLNNRRIYGAYTWYEWSRENWGTKWNAYEQPDKRNSENQIFFQTAWACPFKVISALSKAYPDVEFEIAWADEDLGCNIGSATFLNGEKTSENEPEGGSLAAKKMFFDITQDTLEQHNMNKNYEYIGED